MMAGFGAERREVLKRKGHVVSSTTGRSGHRPDWTCRTHRFLVGWLPAWFGARALLPPQTPPPTFPSCKWWNGFIVQ